MEQLTDARLAELEALCAAATPGPWIWESTAGARVRLWTKASGDYVIETGRKPGGWEYLDMDEGDAGFIAHARTALPEALAEVRRLRNKLNTDSQAFELQCRKAETDLLRADNARMSTEGGELVDAYEALVDRCDRLRVLVQSREWDSDGFCQWCYALRTNGHIADCPWKVALGGAA